LKFDFAKIWEPARGSLEEVTEDARQIQGNDAFWAKILEQSKQKEEEGKEKMGRGARRKAAATVAAVSPLFSLFLHLIPVSYSTKICWTWILRQRNRKRVASHPRPLILSTGGLMRASPSPSPWLQM
jgi:hypothetical protein